MARLGSDVQTLAPVPGTIFSSASEARACLALCAVKEFLVVATVILMAIDFFDIWFNIVRLTGTEWLPFPGNHTALHISSAMPLDWFDLVASCVDLISVLLLSLSGAPHCESEHPSSDHVLYLRTVPRVPRLARCSVQQLGRWPRVRTMRLRDSHGARSGLHLLAVRRCGSGLNRECARGS